MKIKIEKANLEDAEQIFKLFSEARGRMSYLPKIHSDDETYNFVKNLCGENTFKATGDDQILGFINIENGWVNHLYILPGYEGKGIGKKLLDFAKDKNSNLSLWVFEQNSKAIKFYEREGFVLIEKRNKDEANNEENLPDRKYLWKA